MQESADLRGNFGTEYSKRPAIRSGDGADSQWVSKWQYFTPMLFLKDIVAPRKCSSSLASLVNTDNEVMNEADDSIQSFDLLDPTSPSPKY